MAQRRALELGLDDVRITVVTPEETPLAIFGPAASDAVSALLLARGIEVEAGVFAHEGEGGGLILTPGDRRMDAAEVVALPVMEGPAIAGLPKDDGGFIPIDEHARVRGVEDVYAAGDGTNFPIKQGGLGTQQADAAAMHIGHRLGAGIAVEPFRPVLRGKLLTGEESLPPPRRRGGRRRRGRGRPRLPVVAPAQDQRPVPGALPLPRRCPRGARASATLPRRRGGATEGVARATDGARPIRLAAHG